jgi:hypothetical protein
MLQAKTSKFFNRQEKTNFKERNNEWQYRLCFKYKPINIRT